MLLQEHKSTPPPPHFGIVFRPDNSVLVAIPKHVAQSWPFLMEAAVCCWLRATSGAGVQDLGWTSPLLILLMCWGWCSRAELQVLPCREQTRGPWVTQAWSCLGTWDFGKPGHSMLWNLCHVRQVSCASMEADVALVGDNMTFGIEGKQSQTQSSASWRCTVGCTHPCAWGCVSSQLPNIIPVLKWGTEQPTAVSDFPVSHRLGLCVKVRAASFQPQGLKWRWFTAAGSLLEHRALPRPLSPSGISPMGAGLVSVPGMLKLGWKQGTGEWNRALVGWYLVTDSLSGVSGGWDPADKLSIIRMDLSVKSWFDVEEFSFLPTPVSDKTVMFSWDKYSAVSCSQGFFSPSHLY